jgi:hypothetical protein
MPATERLNERCSCAARNCSTGLDDRCRDLDGEIRCTQVGNSSAWVLVRTSAAGNKFIQTHADSVWRDNLLA